MKNPHRYTMNKTDAGNNSHGIFRVIDATHSQSPNPGRSGSFMKSFLVLTTILVLACNVAHSQTTNAPRTVSSQEWTGVLLLAKDSKRSKQRDLSTILRETAISLSEGQKKVFEAASKTSQITDQQIVQNNQVALISVLLAWYSSEIQSPPKTKKETERWQLERVGLATMCGTLKQQFGQVVEESWNNLMSACHTLGLPEGVLPR